MNPKPGADPRNLQTTPKRELVDLKKMVDKARSDVALSNPIGFLIRMMGGEEIDGERLSVRDRVEVAKYLSGKMIPNLESHEVTTDVRGMPPPLVISLNVTPQESLRVVSEQAKRDNMSAQAVEHIISDEGEGV